MIFEDRIDAGTKLAHALDPYAPFNQGVVIALPRGGVPVGAMIAKRFSLPLDIICPRKITAPFNPEYAIGAITEEGDLLLNEPSLISQKELDQACKKETIEAARRIKIYRAGQAQVPLKGKQVILVDDGLATGSTIRAAIRTIYRHDPEKLIVAVPVGPPDTCALIKKEVDALIVLSTPDHFQAVGQFYTHFPQTSDEEVLEWMQRD